MARFKHGEEVVLWTRPADNLVLVFGVGNYEGDELVNGAIVPVVKMHTGEEVVLHYDHVWCGRKDDVERTIQRNAKKVVAVEWDLDDYLNGKLPDDATLNSLKAQVEIENASELGGVAQAREARTMTDRALLIAQEIKLLQKKIEMYEACIVRERNAIDTKKKQLKELKETVLRELAALEVGEVPEEKVQATAADELPPVEQTASVSTDALMDAAQRAAMED